MDRIGALRQALRRFRSEGRRIGLVPTMGALHEGHLSLIREAKRRCDAVVVSIYVNPTQFVAGEDLASYPRPLDADLAACRVAGADLVFTPDNREMYGSEPLTTVAVSGLTEGLCGVHRPGHFQGVTTVVAKLFNIVQPDVAVFGQKDAQQAIVIRKMTVDLNFPIEIVVCPTVREADGLAMSSRNAYLTPVERRQAGTLYRALQEGRRMIVEGRERSAGVVVEAMRRLVVGSGSCGVDYVEIRDEETLRTVEPLSGRVLLALAVRIGKARLIDNMVVEVPPGG